MKVNNTTWNRIRYDLAAPLYDVATAPLQAAGFGAARRRAMGLLAPESGSHVLLIGAGTGLDLRHIPPDVRVVATDLSPRMIRQIRRRATRLGREVEARVMDGERLTFPDGTFDHVVLHLVLAVMPDPYACAREVARVLKPGGTVSIFDKFVPDGDSPSLLRRAVNVLANAAFSDLNRQLGPILDAGGLTLRERATAVGGWFTVALAEKVPEGPGTDP